MSFHQHLPLFKQSAKPALTSDLTLTDDEKIAWIQLLRSRRVGGSTFFRLLREHETAQAALEALPQIAKTAGVNRYTACPKNVAITELQAAQKHNATMVHWGSARYPKKLAEISDPPPFFWAIGDLTLLKSPTLAIVGARNASSLGLRVARELSKTLCDQGYSIVSGLARGIDTAAHQATRDGGTTIAVLAGGLDRPYPRENETLFVDICQNGLAISERPFGYTAQARDFPRRNRLISGLAQAVLVVEAAAKSGSLITAKNALDQGRDVMAVPGHPLDARASGCNLLIRDGATLIRNARDVLEQLPAQNPPDFPQMTSTIPSENQANETPKDAKNSKLRQHILDSLGPTPQSEDKLIHDISETFCVRMDTILPELLQLELTGKVTRQAGGLLSKSV